MENTPSIEFKFQRKYLETLKFDFPPLFRIYLQKRFDLLRERSLPLPSLIECGQETLEPRDLQLELLPFDDSRVYGVCRKFEGLHLQRGCHEKKRREMRSEIWRVVR